MLDGEVKIGKVGSTSTKKSMNLATKSKVALETTGVVTRSELGAYEQHP